MRQILIDSSNLWCRAYYATQMEGAGPPCSIMAFMLRNIIRYFGPSSTQDIVLCWDKGRSGRDELDSNYKQNRELQEGKEKIWEDIAFVKKMVSYLGFCSSFLDGYEADDVIASLAQNYYGETIIVSNDKDFYQLVSDKDDVKIFKPEQKTRAGKNPAKIIKEKDVFEEFGCHPENVVLYKTFKGDTSDNIPKLSSKDGKTVRWSKKFKEPFYSIISSDEVKTVEDFYNNIKSFDPKYQQSLNLFRETAETNFKLVEMKKDLAPEKWSMKSCRKKFEDLCLNLKIDIDRLRFSDFQ